MSIRSICIVIMAVLASLAFPMAVSAQSYSRIVSGGDGTTAINLETRTIAATPAPEGWWSAQWELIGSHIYGPTDAYLLRNRYTGEYLVNRGGTDDGTVRGALALEKGTANDPWVIERIVGVIPLFRIRPYSRPNLYLQMRDGALTVAPIPATNRNELWVLDERAFQIARAQALNGRAAA
ncbi:RICIN domain-containing protein [Sphingomonas sp. CJ99]